MVLKELILNSFYFWRCVAVLKELVFTISNLGECGGLEELILNSFYFERVWWS